LEKDQKNTLHRRRLILEGRSKRIYDSTQPGVAILEFKSEFGHSKEARSVPHKSELNASVSHHIFTYLHSFHISTHHLGVFAKHELMVKKLEMIPIAVVVRNIAAGSLATRYGLPEGRELEFPIVELVYKNESLNHPILNESHVLAFGISTPEEVRSMMRLASKTNAVMRSFCERRHLRLVDIWFEFGRCEGQVLLGDEITPDTCRFMDVESATLYDGSVYRLGLGDYAEAYAALAHRLIA
jgi:phosphoribosylaminoimidazole-succinocarboxamide synthase